MVLFGGFWSVSSRKTGRLLRPWIIEVERARPAWLEGGSADELMLAVDDDIDGGRRLS